MTPTAQRRLLVVDVAGKELAFDLAEVEECVPATGVTPLPSLPDCVLGVAALRGRIMTVVDGAQRFSLGMGLRRYFAVCRVNGRSTALAIDDPIVAHEIPVRELDQAEATLQLAQMGLSPDVVLKVYEWLEGDAETGYRATGRFVPEIRLEKIIPGELWEGAA